MTLSVFDIFKIGVGPSSSHTMGPMVAAARFLAELGVGPVRDDLRLRCSLHGALAFTGRGHRTDRAVILGLCGVSPEACDPAGFDAIVDQVRHERRIHPAGQMGLAFDPAADLVFDYKTRLPGHSNGMRFTALDESGGVFLERVYYSVGGGFVCDESELAQGARGTASELDLPYPFTSAADMLHKADRSALTIAEMMRANERCVRSDTEIDAGLDRLWGVMNGCIERGLRTRGELPGGMRVQRRAADLFGSLDTPARADEPLPGSHRLSAYAIAVNEENAAGGRVVTAPTNGAAGVIPAVCRYYLDMEQSTAGGIRDMLLTAAAIGSIIKRNASISGAEVGCQGEVGSASAMAAAALCAALGGTNEQIENAAEIALEHHLGMTCDPVRGLVQVPCIERNGMGAVKAVAAASLAALGDGQHIVPLDACIQSMRDTGRDMSERYKETSLGGLAVNLPEC